MSEADCASNRGTTDGGNKAGCTGDSLFCCRIKKNRCHDEITVPNKIYFCTGETECTAKGGTPKEKGAGCNVSGSYPQCCEFNDDTSVSMGIPVGEPLKGVSAAVEAAGGAVGSKRVPRKYQDINAFCFTETECANASALENWVKGQGCPNKGNTPQGFCKAPAPEYQLQYPLAGVTTISGLKNFIGLIFNYGMGLILIVAAMFFVYGGLRYLFSAVANDVQVAKTVMTDSLAGLVLGLAAYAILANVNFNTVNLRSFDVYMINQLSFYDTIYCADMKPAAGKTEVKFQEAGTPFAPVDLDIKKGYPLSAKDTQCGHEYFIDGGDSLSVCAGSGCGKGLCLNCSGGQVNCKSSSEKEHTCFDSHFGGNVVVGGCQSDQMADWKNNKVEPVLFCDTGSKQEYVELSSVPIEGKKVDKGVVSGQMGGYALKIDMAKVKDFQGKCKGKSGFLLEYHFDTGGIVKTGIGGAWYHYIDKKCKVDPAGDFFSMRLLSGNLYSESAFGKMTPERRTAYFNSSWTLDEVLASEKKPVLCNFTYDAGALCKAGSTGLGPNWHD